MQTLVLKESRAPYQVALDDSPMQGDVVILEKNGQAVAAVVSMTEYLEFQAWREIEQHKHNQQLLPQLRQQHPGRVVAIHNGKVITVGDDRMEVWQRARQQVGKAPVYIQTVEAFPKVYKMPVRKVVADVGI